MIKRVQQLQNIGRFSSCQLASVQFEKITIIFGRNTYGKSTFFDLLNSIQSKDLRPVSSRKTIPDDGNPQLAKINFLSDASNSEIVLKLANNQWNPTDLPDGLRIKIYDDSFYYKNIFSSRQFSRETKENLSDFILGEQGVAKASLIEEKNKSRRSYTQEKNKIEKEHFKNIEDLTGFIQFNPIDTLESIQEKLKELQIEESSLEKQKKNTDNILLRESLNTLNWDNLYQTDFFNTQELLKKSFEGIHKVAKDKVLLHIQKYFKDPSNAEAEDWLYKGTLQNDGINCQFCSQKLNNEAISLLDLYQKIFDNSYIEFEGTIKNELENVLRKLKGSKSTDTTIKIEKNYAAISSYPELLEQDEFKSLFNRFKESSEKIKDLLKKFDLEEKNFLDFLKLNINNKMNLYNTKIDMEYSNEIFNFENNILALIEEFNQVIEKINKLIEDYKSSFTDFTIYNKIKNIKKEITIHSRTLKRVELSEHCEKYKKLEEDIIVLSTSITSLQAELSLEQSQYLADYFVDLNNYFIKFGTKNFVIEKNEDISGHKPIYFLKVKFKNTPIPEKELDLIFSESDRRALALSVFWTNLIRLSPDEKLKTIILLDDAVTSFDENRIMAVHKSLIEIVDSVRQIISLSHYKSEIARFLMTYKEHRHIKLLEISALNDSSSLIISDVNEFIKDEHEKTRDKMLRFINNETNVVEFGDLRIFLEYEIKQRFALQIKEKSISEGMLSDLLKKLKSENIISEIVFKEMDEWRILLNPSHHIWIGADFEDKRTTANSFMDFIYNRLKSI